MALAQAPLTTAQFLSSLTGGKSSAAVSKPASLADILASATTSTPGVSAGPAFGNIGDLINQATAPKNVNPGAFSVEPTNSSQLAAALALAKQSMGGFDSSPYDQAIAAAQAAAASSEGSAKKTNASVLKQDQSMYDALGNYIGAAQKAGKQDTKTTEKDLSGTYNAAGTNIKQTYGNSAAQSSSDLARLGLDPTLATNPSAADAKFFTSENQENKANAKGNERTAGSAFNQLEGQTKGDVKADAADTSAAERNSLQQVLAAAESALNTNLAGINESKATAQDSYQSQLRSAAQSLLSSQAANDPNSLDNQLKELKLASGYSKLVPQGSGQTPEVAPNFSGKKGMANAEQFLQLPEQQGGAGLTDPTIKANLLSFLQRAQAGHLGTTTSGYVPFTTQNLSGTATSLEDMVAKVIGQYGYGAKQQNALDDAIQIALGKY